MTEKLAMEYVAGFMFNSKKTEVVLILKNRPPYQCGKFNGVGGKIEPGETPKEAMIREFREETGIETQAWRNFCIMEGSWGRVHFFTTCGNIYDAKTMTDEHVAVFKVATIGTLNLMPQLPWLIPLALYEENCITTVTEI